MLEDGQIWNIIDHNEWVIFQSSDRIYFYNTQSETFKIISTTNIIYKIFKVKNRIYYHVANEGVYVIEDGKPKLIVNSTVLKSERVINIFENNKNLIILTRSSGFYKLENDKISSWNISSDPLLKKPMFLAVFNLKMGVL